MSEDLLEFRIDISGEPLDVKGSREEIENLIKVTRVLVVALKKFRKRQNILEDRIQRIDGIKMKRASEVRYINE